MLPNDLDHALGSGVQNLPSQICVLLLPRHSLGLPGAWMLPSLAVLLAAEDGQS